MEFTTINIKYHAHALEHALLGEDAEERHDEGDVVVLAPHVLLLVDERREASVEMNVGTVSPQHTRHPSIHSAFPCNAPHRTFQALNLRFSSSMTRCSSSIRLDSSAYARVRVPKYQRRERAAPPPPNTQTVQSARAPTCCICSSSTVAPSVKPGSSGSLSTAPTPALPDSSWIDSIWFGMRRFGRPKRWEKKGGSAAMIDRSID